MVNTCGEKLKARGGYLLVLGASSTKMLNKFMIRCLSFIALSTFADKASLVAALFLITIYHLYVIALVYMGNHKMVVDFIKDLHLEKLDSDLVGLYFEYSDLLNGFLLKTIITLGALFISIVMCCLYVYIRLGVL